MKEIHRRFCVEYLKDFDNSGAYIRAGYKVKSKEAASAAASRLLSRSDVQAYLQQQRNKVEDKAQVTLAELVQELGHVAMARFTDVAAFSDDDLTIASSEDLPDKVLAAIASVERTETITDASATVKKSVKMHDKMKAAQLLFKFFGVGTDFNQARASLKRYGLALIPSEESDTGWKLERHVG